YTTDVNAWPRYAILSICSTHRIASPLPAGSRILLLWDVDVEARWGLRMRAFAVTGLASQPFDRTAYGFDRYPPPQTGRTETTNFANELLVGAIGLNTESADEAGFRPDINGTLNNCSNTGSPTYTALEGVGSDEAPSLFAMYCIVSATGRYVASVDASYSQDDALWTAALGTYVGASPTPALTPTATPTPATTGTPLGTPTPA